ncbi:MAG TPA: DNA polymerase IV [Thermoanaerobaculia bacterium]|nr:DNA polymerase IV [Thermoanaerobaculia bacterium]
MRKIVHVDMDAFYASVEQRDRPELRGKPVIVAWSQQARGVVVAASYEARKFGVRSAIPATRAVRVCPEGIFVRPDFERYRAVSNQIREIFLRHTPLVEPLSLDEAYLDVTEELTGIPTATETAATIRREIREETGLTASAGVAPNKFLAKIASDWRKPDGLFVIRPHEIDRFLLPLPVGKIPGVGRVTERALAERGITTVAHLREWTSEELTKYFGSFGQRLWELARGIDDHPVVPERESKSISCENTFSEDIAMESVKEFMTEAAQKVWDSVQKHELSGRTVTVKLRLPDFTTATRRLTLPDPVPDAASLASAGVGLLERFPFPPDSKFRLAGLGLSNFIQESDGEDEESEPRLF